MKGILESKPAGAGLYEGGKAMFLLACVSYCKYAKITIMKLSKATKHFF